MWPVDGAGSVDGANGRAAHRPLGNRPTDAGFPQPPTGRASGGLPLTATAHNSPRLGRPGQHGARERTSPTGSTTTAAQLSGCAIQSATRTPKLGTGTATQDQAAPFSFGRFSGGGPFNTRSAYFRLYPVTLQNSSSIRPFSNRPALR